MLQMAARCQEKGSNVDLKGDSLLTDVTDGCINVVFVNIEIVSQTLIQSYFMTNFSFKCATKSSLRCQVLFTAYRKYILMQAVENVLSLP